MGMTRRELLTGAAGLAAAMAAGGCATMANAPLPRFFAIEGRSPSMKQTMRTCVTLKLLRSMTLAGIALLDRRREGSG